MEAIACPSAAKISVLLALQRWNVRLRFDGRHVKNRVRVVKGAQDVFWCNGFCRVERDDDGLLKRDGLQLVDEVVQAHIGMVWLVWVKLHALVIPSRPRCFTLRRDSRCGVFKAVFRYLAVAKNL